jgi:hypothetical protein
MSPLVQKSELYKSATDALKNLIKAEGSDVAERAASEVFGPIREQEFLNSRRLKKAGGRLCVKRLTGKRCTAGGSHKCTRFPKGASDHNSLWSIAGKPAAYVAQPYELSLDELDSIVQFCRKHGLQCSVNAKDSWHFPGRTLSVNFTPSGK